MMATEGGEDAKAEVFTSSPPVVFSDFVDKCDFPEFVVVTNGSYLSKNVQISKGDILLLKSLDHGKVTLSYSDDTNKQWTEVRVPVDSNMKFSVLLPKESQASGDPKVRPLSMVMYPTVSDLLIDCPTYFEATAAYDDPYLPGLSIRAGDRFRFVNTQETREGKLNLEVTDDFGNSLVLTSGCRGNFCPLEDSKNYTLKELVELAPVQRRLKLVSTENPSDSRENLTTLVKLEDAQALGSDASYIDKHSSFVKKINSNRPVSLPSRASDSETISVAASSSSTLPARLSTKDAQFPTNHLPCDIDVSRDSMTPNVSDPISLPASGDIHLHAPEPVVLASPYGNSKTIWNVPLSANIHIKRYTPTDYEIPQLNQNSARTEVPLPLPPLSPDGDVPRYPAPSTPPLPQPLVPLSVNSFADIYAGSLPAKAKLLDLQKCESFFQNMFVDTQDLHVYRTEDENRLYVKDSKSDDVYGLSRDLNISFLEYPEKFSEVSELIGLPIGTELTVLEDIASDYPKPISLRFGDIIRVCTNSPQLMKMKYGSKDCEVLKVEKIDPGGGDCSKLKLPTDFEVRMTMSTGSSSPQSVSLRELLSGSTPAPTGVVASLLGEQESHHDHQQLINFPADVTILKAMKQTVLVVAAKSAPYKHKRAPSLNSDPSISSFREGEGGPSTLLGNIGLPVTCGAVLAFQGRLDISEMDTGQFSDSYLRLPVERLTMAEYEERERLRKLNLDYEDMTLDSSDLSVNECGAERGGLQRTHSTGVLDRREKRLNLDKVRRLSRALNPKHWRQSRPEPEPLPHPSAMGLMALAARPSAGCSNDYQQEQLEKTNSAHSGSTNTGGSSDEEETENLYEDVEIGPIKSSSLTSSSAQPSGKGRMGAFSGFLHKSLPSPRRNRRGKAPSKVREGDGGGAGGTAGADGSGRVNVNGATSGSSAKEAGKEAHSYDVPRSGDRAVRWVGKPGDKTRVRYDIPQTSGKSKEGKEMVPGMYKPYPVNDSPSATSPPSDRAPSPPMLPPPRTVSLGTKDKTTKGNDVKDKNIKLGNDCRDKSKKVNIDSRDKPMQLSNDNASDGPVAPIRRKKVAKALQASKDSSKEKMGTSTEQTATGVSNGDTTSDKKTDESARATDSTNAMRIQPLPRKSLLHEENKSGPLESKEGSLTVKAPKPKPRGLKSQMSSDSQPAGSTHTVSDVIKSMESLTMDSGGGHKTVKEAAAEWGKQTSPAPSPIKPRSS